MVSKTTTSGLVPESTGTIRDIDNGGKFHPGASIVSRGAGTTSEAITVPWL